MVPRKAQPARSVPATNCERSPHLVFTLAYVRPSPLVVQREARLP